MILLLLGLATALHDLAALEASASAVAGSLVTVDRRLRLAACPEPVVARNGAAVAITCAAPAWRIIVPAQPLAPIVPIIRRGDTVSVTVAGVGFRVAIDGVAEADAVPGGRVGVRAGAGSHLTALVLADGSLAVPGFTSP